MKRPCFEAYLAIDIPEPLNSEIYAIRETFSDKKMTAMPVDIPVFGHYDTSMALVRNLSQLEKCLNEVGSLKAQSGESDCDETPHNCWNLEASHFEVHDGALMLIFADCPELESTVQAIYDKLESLDLSGEVFKVERPLRVYVVEKTHLSRDVMDQWNGRPFKRQICASRITLYHKEAVPLTRVDSWVIR